jgi:hypothetical protein
MKTWRQTGFDVRWNTQSLFDGILSKKTSSEHHAKTGGNILAFERSASFEIKM